MGEDEIRARRSRGDDDVVSRHKGMLVLSCFSARHCVLTSHQIAKLVNLEPHTVSRLAENLVLVGCLRRDVLGGYKLAKHFMPEA